MLQERQALLVPAGKILLCQVLTAALEQLAVRVLLVIVVLTDTCLDLDSLE